jgi:membrane protein implicated in regulation of membrane protease activity
VAYQYHLRPLPGAVLAVMVHAALAAGVVLAIPSGAPPFSIISVCWSLIIAGLGRMLWELVRRGGSRADVAMAQAEQLRQRNDHVSR